jgi:hypothetical protein
MTGGVAGGLAGGLAGDDVLGAEADSKQLIEPIAFGPYCTKPVAVGGV